MDFSKKYDRPSPEVEANPFSRLMYGWLFPFLKYGYSNDLEVKDLYNTTERDISENLGNKLERNWEQEVQRAKEEDQKPSLVRAIRLTFMKSYAFYGIELFFQSVILKLTQPLVLAMLIKYFDHSKETLPREGWLLATGLILISFANAIIMHHASLGQARIGMQCRVATCSLIYKKLLRLNKSSVAQTAAGQVVNLLSNDVGRFDIVPLFLHYVWIMPIVTIIAGGIMYNSIGYAAFAGIIAITLQAVPLQGYLSRLQGKLRYKIAHRTDRRVQQMSEITSGIRVIKMYAWEKPFEKIVALARKLEIDQITIASYIKGFVVALAVFTERFTLFLTVIAYVLLGNPLTGDKVFSMAQFFNTIQLYMAIFFPLAISSFAEARTSVKRIEGFLMQDEIIVPIESNMEPPVDKCGTIKITNGKASWIPNPIMDTLININLNIKPGSLYAVVGPVGAGKSSLLQLLLKELPINHGRLEIMGSISYASQEPWLFVSSVRNNILFGLPYTKSKYKSVVKVCALERDFELLPNGEHTLVGERGASLSGGQRARVNLARAVYRQADIYLLDDPLSAVDAHVSKHLFDECILKYLQGKTRILVTHQLQFLKFVDQIIIIKNGLIEKIGTYAELADKELAHLKLETEEADVKETESKLRKSRLMSITSHKSGSTEEADEENEPAETQELMEKGAISTSLYWTYFRQGGGICILLFLILMLILAQASCNASDIWVSHWTNVEEARYAVMTNESQTTTSYLNGANDLLNVSSSIPTNTIENLTNISSNDTDLQNKTENIKIEPLRLSANDSNILRNSSSTVPYYLGQRYYIYVYTALIVASILLTTFRSFIFYRVCMNASKGLHNTMFHNILQSTMRFFDTNPSGRILNRFSKDMGAVDEMLPRALLDALQIFLVMFGILAMVFIVTPWMVAPTIVLAILFYLVRKIYLASAQDIKRLEGTTKAPVFSHVSATFDGLVTIRSANAQTMVAKEFDILQDQHTSSWFLYLATSEAFGFYLDMISIIFLVVLTYQFLIFDNGTTLSASVGLVISHSLILTGMLQFGMRQTAEVANQMTSVERIMQYTRLEKEGPFESSPTKKPSRDWPQRGRIIFKNLTLQYLSGEPPVLNHINIEIEAGSKVGIVGRTGAGKSSLIAALFRLAPIEGSIIIDNTDSKEIGLHDLRTKISIIPQEPVLFTASIRYNLDPIEKSEDKELWKALEDVELKEHVAHLNQEVTEGGSNFSAGQRQLVCLARAILQNNKILVMDEATANVDLETDQLIQATIRRNFNDCTVLTIAHRLNTIMDSDKVLVMDAGEAVEYGPPFELLQNENSYFSKMVKETGPGMESKLRAVAQEAYNSKQKGAIVKNDQDANSVDVQNEKKDN